MRIPRRRILHEDLDWFGIDLHGHIGHFSSFGAGCLPEAVACNQDALRCLSMYFDKQLSDRGRAVLEFGLDLSPAEAESWLVFARRGLFSFDAQHPGSANQCYRRVAVPQVPLAKTELPTRIQQLLSATHTEFAFAEASVVPLTAFGPLAPA